MRKSTSPIKKTSARRLVSTLEERGMLERGKYLKDTSYKQDLTKQGVPALYGLLKSVYVGK